jgi:hypothetical protein
VSARERQEYGRARRKVLPRSALGEYAPSSRRGDPVAPLESQSKNRVPELVPIRYTRMSASPYAFVSGAAVIMAADLAAGANTGMRVQLCGDAHLSNFGLYASPERHLMFALNDFDETLPGPVGLGPQASGGQSWSCVPAGDWVLPSRSRLFGPAHRPTAARCASPASASSMCGRRNPLSTRICWPQAPWRADCRGSVSCPSSPPAPH